MVKAIGWTTSGSAAKSVAVKPSGILIRLAASSGGSGAEAGPLALEGPSPLRAVRGKPRLRIAIKTSAGSGSRRSNIVNRSWTYAATEYVRGYGLVTPASTQGFDALDRPNVWSRGEACFTRRE